MLILAFIREHTKLFHFLAITILLFISAIPISSNALPSNFTDSTLVGGLNAPTAMEFSPDGRLFVTEMGGKLRVIKNGVLLSNPFVSLSVNSVGERGLLGIAFDPDFDSNGYVYVYYTTSSSPIHNRVSRFTADPANPDRALAGSELQLLNLETLSATNHNGGAIHFGKDGKLYIATGDNANSANSQSLSTRLGKILRINPDGTIPSDNPFYNTVGAKKEIWALGLRNPFTFAFSPTSSSTLMYINDVGQDSREEIDSGTRGANYGWPTCEGSCSNSGFVNPIYSYAHNGAGKSIAGGAFYEASQFPTEYKGSYFFGDYVAGFIKRLKPDMTVVDFLTGINAPVDIKVGPDGSLYYLSIGAGQVRKVQYTASSSNSPPNAVATASPSSGPVPLTATLAGSGSSDPNGDTLSYSWNFGDGTPAASGVSVTHTYNNAGSYTATLTVSDGRGGIDSATVNIAVGSPPVGTIDTPASGTKYDAGNTISFTGSGTDAQDGTLPASAFSWVILFHHNTHTHPFMEFDGVKSGSFTIARTGETSDDVWYRIYLTVTDSTGLTHLSTRDVLPNKATITLAGNVAGLQVNLDGQPHTTPYSFVGVVGITRSLQAPSTQTVNGQTYQFDSWSDGGAATHTINTPSTTTTYNAKYSIIHMSDTTASRGIDVSSSKPVRAEYVSSTSQLIGDKIDQITLRLAKVGSPTGTAQIGVFSDTSVKKLFGTKDVSTISTAYSDYTFSLTNNDLYTIQAGDRIGIKYSGGSGSRYVLVMIDADTTDPFDGQKSYSTQRKGGSWQDETSTDMYMILRQTVIPVSAVSATHMSDTTSSFASLISAPRQLIAEFVTPTSQLVGDPIDSITLRLQKFGSPTGTAQIGIFNSDLTVKKLFGTIDVSTISSSSTNYEFKLLSSDPLYIIAANDRIGIKYTGGSSTTGINVTPDRDASDPFDGSNSYRVRYETSWIDSALEDMYMILKQTHG